MMVFIFCYSASYALLCDVDSQSILTNYLQRLPTHKDNDMLTWPAAENCANVLPSTESISSHDPLRNNDSVHDHARSKSQDLRRHRYGWSSLSSRDFVNKRTPTRTIYQLASIKPIYRLDIPETLTKHDTGGGNIGAMVEDPRSKVVIFDLPGVPASCTN